jgi:hypothetical protein
MDESSGASFVSLPASSLIDERRQITDSSDPYQHALYLLRTRQYFVLKHFIKNSWNIIQNQPRLIDHIDLEIYADLDNINVMQPYAYKQLRKKGHTNLKSLRSHLIKLDNCVGDCGCPGMVIGCILLLEILIFIQNKPSEDLYKLLKQRVCNQVQ